MSRQSALEDDDIEIVRELYTAGLPARQLAAKYNISIHTVYMYIRGNKRGRKPYEYKNRECKVPIEEREVIRALFAHGMKVTQIAEKYNINTRTVYYYVQGVKKIEL